MAGVNGSAVGSALELLLGAMFLAAAGGQYSRARRTGGTWVGTSVDLAIGIGAITAALAPVPSGYLGTILLATSGLAFLAGLVLLVVKRRRARHRNDTREPPP